MALAVGGVSAAGAPSASAMPNYCHGGTYRISTEWTAWTQCSPGASGSYFRTVARCYHLTPTGTRDYYYRYGTWEWQNSTAYPLTNGGASYAHCNSGDYLYSYDAQLS